jgi:molybdate transport system substrate-binding protein
MSRLFVLSLLLACLSVQAAQVRVAVAANFAGPMARIGQAFSAATGHELRTSSGSTGKFYSQIVNGAPFDVLLAADEVTPGKLLASGHAVAGTRFTYSVGRLVLWSATPGFVDGQGAVLASPTLRRLAIANPKVAPYGAAAMQTMKARGLLDVLTPRLVTGESIAQAYQFVFTGNAEAGFVALSQVAVPGKPATGSWWLVPQELHAPIRQDAVLLQAGRDNAAARALLDFLKTEAAKKTMRDFGYGP